MEKPASLRAAIVAADPQYGRDADRLQMWVDEGRIRSPMTADRGFGWDYTLNITLTDCTVHPSVIFLAINDWARLNQPDLLAAQPHAGYKFEADIIDAQTVDLHIVLKLTEQVVLVPDPETGAMSLQHVAEPDLSWLNGGVALSSLPASLADITASSGTGAPIPLPFP